MKNSVSRDDTITPNPDGDDVSIGECSIAAQSDTVSVHAERNQSMQKVMNFRLFKLLSVMYALLVVVVGAIVTIGDMSSPVNDMDHLYSIVMTLIR